MLVLPGGERVRAIESRDRGSEHGPAFLRRPHDPGTTRGHDPFVGSGRDEVKAQRSERLILIAESMHGIQDEQHVIVLVSTLIDIRDDPGQCLRGNLHSRTGMHPGQSHHACMRTNPRRNRSTICSEDAAAGAS